MLSITQSQVDSLTTSLRLKSLQELTDHARAFAPELARVAGDLALRQFVKSVVSNATRHELATREHVRSYLEIALILGLEFESDPQFPWARNIIEDRVSAAQTRVAFLYRELQNYFDAVAGPNHQFARNAFGRYRHLQATETVHAYPHTLAKFPEWLECYYPEKYAYVGPDRMAEITRKAATDTNSFDLNESAVAVVAGLMLTFGFHVLANPLYPWILSALSDKRITSQEARERRLVQRVQVYLTCAARNLEKRVDKNG